MSHVVSAACVLYNFCLFADQGDIEQFLDDNGDDGDDSDSDQPDQSMPQAIAKRNLMVQYLDCQRLIWTAIILNNWLFQPSRDW